MEYAFDDSPYCRLYIDTDESLDMVQDILDSEVAKHFERVRVHAPVFKNDSYLAVAKDMRPYDPIDASRWTAEMDTEANAPGDFEAFEVGTIAVIAALRRRGFIVTASCDFEDRVEAETGWNWTLGTPNPPS
jgi:hypothetical protein